jgi:sigma-B regulation protein RsbU (phosphoserine phosphatase)
MTITIGKVEKIFAALLVVSIALSLANAGPALRLLVNLPLYFFGAWAFFRISRRLVHNAMWRLRNRLIVAYIFIGLVPVVLVLALAALGGYLVGGQLSIYLITSELDRRTSSLRAAAEYIIRDPGHPIDWAKNVALYMQSRYPSVMVVAKNPDPWVYPTGTNISAPPDGWGDASGLVVKDGVLHVWARAVRNSNSVTLILPLTDQFLGDLASGLGKIDIVDFSASLEGRNNLLRAAPVESASEPSKNRLPPAVNAFDWQVHWPSPIQIAVWDKPGTYLPTSTMIVSTRPSAVLRTVMPQKLEFAAEFIPALFITVAVLFLIAELISLIIGLSLTRTITGAVHDLYEGTVRVMKGDFSHRIPPHGTDQLGELVQSFNQMSENLQRLVQVEKERERLQNELEIAREVQNQLYPKNVPALSKLRITAACQPARMVSGDYYDYQKVEPDGAAIAMGDVAGKGISAALLMATVQSSFRTELRGALELASATPVDGRIAKVSTSTLVSHLNQQIFNFTAPEKYTTFFFGLWDDNRRTLTYTNAGHLPPVLVRSGSTSRLNVNGTVVGAFPFAEFDSNELSMDEGDLLVFFTDGITEPENEYGEEFGEERLFDLLVKNVHLQEDALIQLVMTAAQQWSGKSELQDDMTLVLMRSI